MKLFLSLLLTLASISIFAVLPSGYPTHEVYKIKTDLDISEAKVALRKVVRTEVVTVSTTLAASTSFNTSIIIPADAVITDGWILVNGVKIVSANDNTLSVGCESVVDVFAATDMTDTATGAFTAGVATGAAANYIASDGCTVTYATGAGASGITAGVWTIGLEYFTKE